MDKFKVGVIFGGCSSEYSVSLQSAYSVIENMDREKYIPVLMGISRLGEWFHYTGSIENIKNDTWLISDNCVPAIISPDRSLHGIIEFRRDGVYTQRLDAAFPVLHGKNGEDGTVQGLLELASIPIIGCKTLSSSICMDKDKAHKLAHIAGIRVPLAFVVQSSRGAEEQAKEIGYPLFVKPVRAGSSFGITKIKNEDELTDAINLALEQDDRVIIEEAIDGFEVGCAVLGNDRLFVGEVDEIELADGFFNFTEKYNLITSAIHVPARISHEKSEEIKQAAKVIYKALGCSGFARVDMFLTPCGEIVFNEVNTIPGFTSHSRYPNMLNAAGMTFEKVISELIEQVMCEVEIR